MKENKTNVQIKKRNFMKIYGTAIAWMYPISAHSKVLIIVPEILSKMWYGRPQDTPFSKKSQ